VLKIYIFKNILIQRLIEVPDPVNRSSRTKKLTRLFMFVMDPKYIENKEFEQI